MATINSINSNIPIETELGGTGASSLTDHGVLVGSGSSAITALSVGANNSVLAGSTGADPAMSTSADLYMNGISFDSGTNTLSTYTSGTFTPTMVGAGTAGTTTYTAQNGYYRKIGNMAIIWGYIAWSGATGTGDILIGDLPYTIKNQTNGDVVCTVILDSSGTAWPASTTDIQGLGLLNTTTMKLEATASTVTSSNVQMTDTSGSLTFNIQYQV